MVMSSNPHGSFFSNGRKLARKQSCAGFELMTASDLYHRAGNGHLPNGVGVPVMVDPLATDDPTNRMIKNFQIMSFQLFHESGEK